ncbi:hypothetical protein FPV67DRAFT_837505 [Lyophyllum atratum]|nr:hypothetical protein FPV67DRAFT_837505 [Lyophyllum atratum]
MITSTERGLLQKLGYLMLWYIARLATSLLLYGMFTVVFSLTTLAIFRRPVRSLGTWVMFGSTMISFSLAMLYWTSDLAALTMQTWRTLSNGSTGLERYSRGYDDEGPFFVLGRIMDSTVPCLMIINDVIVIWRAWVLCLERRWLIVGPLALLLGTCAAAFTFLGLTSTSAAHTAYVAHQDKVASGLMYAVGALSFSTNVVSTLLIAYWLWDYRKSWNVGVGGRWSHVQTILLMIVESGAVYLLSQIITVVVFNQGSNINTPQAYFETIIWAAYIQSVGMYPTIVLLLIEQKRSFSDMECFVTTLVADSKGQA